MSRLTKVWDGRSAGRLRGGRRCKCDGAYWTSEEEGGRAADLRCAQQIDLIHCRVTSIPALRLDRFKQLERLSLRQNQISAIEFPETLGATLQELDLYDNLIAHIKGLDQFMELDNLDLSFNKIKHIKRLNHMKKLKDLYFVQNKISTIENLEGLTQLRNLELGANRIRVWRSPV